MSVEATLGGPATAGRFGLRERTCDFAVLAALARDGHLYAVVDPAGQPDVYAALTAAGSAAASLYAGRAAEQYAAVAPWVLALDPARLAWCAQALGDDAGSGLFVVARAGLDAVRRQLRRLLTVRLPDGRLVRFRFYDPRLLPPFLRVCTADELRFVYGPIDAFATAAPLTGHIHLLDRASHPAVLPRPRVRPPALDPPRATMRALAPAVLGDR